MSSPQQRGDLIFPSQLGHFDTCTCVPSKSRKSLTNDTLHFEQLAFIPIPHLLHV